MMNTDPLLAVQIEAGGCFNADREQAPRIDDFGDAKSEYEAGRQRAVVVDLSDRTLIRITGDDRVSFLHNFCTSDIRRLQTGQGCEAFVTDVKGRVVGHVFVNVEEDALWLDSVPGADADLLAHFEHYVIMEDVSFEAVTDRWGDLFVTGPDALRVLETCHAGPTAVEVGQAVCGTFRERTVTLFRVDWFGAAGLLVRAEREVLVDLWRAITLADVVPAGAKAFHALRIESVFPLYGVDFDRSHLAPEVDRNELAISYTKGCYLGQEPIARVDALGHVNRVLRGLELASGPVPQRGAAVCSSDGQEVGRVSSAVISPVDGRPRALAMLRAAVAQPGTELFIRAGEKETIGATVYGRKRASSG